MSSPGRRAVERFGFALEFFFAVIRGLDRETDAALDLVDLDDAGFDFLADLEDVLDLVDVIFADLRDVDEAVDVVLQLHERAEAGELGDLAVDEVADLVVRVDVLPRIVAQLLDAEADALVRLVDVDDDGFDFVALLEDFASGD